MTLCSCEALFIATSGDKPEIAINNGKAHVNGILGKRFYKKFKLFIESNPKVKTIVLEYVPGSANDEWNVKSCMLLHQNNMNTELLPTSIIASGGVDLFISGNSRTIQEGAQIGVHSWSDGNKDGIAYPRTSKEHAIFIEMFNKIEMDTAFYWYTLRAAPAKDIHWMTEDEIQKYNLRK